LVFKRAKANEVPNSAKVRRRGFMRLLRDRSGAAAMLAAIAMPIMVGFAGFAVEVGLWHGQKRLLQSAADAGAMGAALTQFNLGGHTAELAAATNDIQANGITVSGNTTVDVNDPPLSGNYKGGTYAGKAVEVILKQPQNVLMMRVIPGISQATTNIAVRAVALQSSLPGPACVISLEPATAGILDSGTPNLTLKKCGAASNSSSSSSSMTDKGNAKVTADYVHLSGECDTCVLGQNLVTSNYIDNGSRVADPYHTMSAPTTSGGTQVDPKVSKNTATLSPGTYTKGLSITGGAVTLSSGVYVISGSTSSLKITGGSVSGTDVTFVIANGASVDIEGNTSVNISAPTTGTYAHMLFYGAGATTKNNGIKFTGTSGQSLNGALYFPKSEVQFSGTSSVGTTCMNIVGLTVNLVGNATSTIDCTGQTWVPTPPTFPQLVE